MNKGQRKFAASSLFSVFTAGMAANNSAVAMNMEQNVAPGFMFSIRTSKRKNSFNSIERKGGLGLEPDFILNLEQENKKFPEDYDKDIIENKLFEIFLKEQLSEECQKLVSSVLNLETNKDRKLKALEKFLTIKCKHIW